ncbi:MULTISPECIES: Slp family lipoprotein [Vibrio]|jgi:outer membrane lipoprotein|uniref:Starvation-inducible protein n=1 Tax=Vibrio mediterranei TaxID=689 RepID=A0AAN1FGH3_9VIBR|nr:MULTISPECIES: Slp family lipoprotein [Vibrio]ASI90168.1 starvation-inducible protein [Vibrio mediterranei]EDL52042.1 starvation-inducible outer membrane lipoprotein [Vibrio mediterranei AK1]KFA98998.1 starvation-inducible protein [Vibrio sp. ER1A]MCF4171640.1 Slp family lipoprotein [Vibrio sp. McD22-P3]MCG9623405.1 Slp family lipoprotein [Vibrio mediterranei]
MNLVTKIVSLIGLSIMLSACGSLPEQLATTNENVVSQYQQVVDAKDGTEVRLGGVIDTVKNLPSQTRIEIVNLPIDKYGKPDLDQEPNGRFIAYVDGFVDPVTYSRGRLITVGGHKGGVERGKVGEFEADFPVIKVYGQYLWRVEERLIINRNPSSFHSCWGYYCDDFYYGPTQGRVIKEVK